MFNRIVAFILLACFSVVAVAAAIPVISQITYLIYNQPAPVTGSAYQFTQGTVYRAHIAVLAQSGIDTVSGVVSGSNDGNNWTTLWNYSITSTVPVASAVIVGPWAMERATVTGSSPTSGVLAASAVYSVNVEVAQ